jgi:O-antigen/teichoic acid export membrane protein
MNVANILNYIFHFIMGRMLGPADYGILAFLTSIIYIFSVPTSAIQTLAARHTTRFNVKSEYGKIKGMIKQMTLEATLLAAILFVIFIIFAFIFAESIGVSFFLLALTGLYLFGAFLSPIGTGVLQGSKKFSEWGWNSILNSLIKIVLAVVLVLTGFRVYGPIIGFFFGAMISFVLVFPYIKNILDSKEVKEKITIISRENFSLLSAVFIITLMYSLDIILVKIFFSPELVGKYAVASMIGKMIFFGTASITNAMFPISSERFFSEDKKSQNLIGRTFGVIFVLCAIATIALFVFPEIIIQLLFGKAYVSISGIMFYLSIAFSFLSLTNTWILYKISISQFRIRHAGILILLLGLQIWLLINYNQSLQSFSWAFMLSSAITFIISIVLIRGRS